ncbi:hypothetical protein BGAFAR04_E0019 (plasmid) [Borreliella garinii Far04]|nr:hypothetical protein BGAFAR04_E0019 [Borreliella garinii Far04]
MIKKSFPIYLNIFQMLLICLAIIFDITKSITLKQKRPNFSKKLIKCS